MKKRRNEDKDMTKDFFEALEILEKERKISKEYLLKKIKDALTTAYKKETGRLNIAVDFDEKNCTIKIYKYLDVVEELEYHDDTKILLADAKKINSRYEVGDRIEVEEVRPKNFGRISIQNAKQVVVQAITEAEKGNLVQEYESKKGQILSAVVTRADAVKGTVILDINGHEISLPKSEQIPGEILNPGDRVKVFVADIRHDTRRSGVIISRANPGLIKKLFELEVPEIADGTVEIKSIAREAGSRTKIAVHSNNPEVDPIGSCIGPKGMRKNNISEEIGGEKIDIIRYSSNCEEFIASALAPAKVLSVTEVEEGGKSYRVLVDDDQLSLAIGVKGQNARLAVKLTECSIDIKSESLLKNAVSEATEDTTEVSEAENEEQ